MMKLQQSQLMRSVFHIVQAVGALMYLACGSRPDISYAMSAVSKSLENPSQNDVTRVKRIFRYLKGTINHSIVYKMGFQKGCLECYSDADHGGDAKTGRSTSGILCVSGGPIVWSSQLQSSVAISTTEAEIVAASEAAREIVWLKRLLTEFGHMENTPVLQVDNEAAREIVWLKRLLTEFGHMENTPVLQVDNEAAVRLAENPELHKRTKHIKLRHFFVRELVCEGEIVVRRVDTAKQLADFLTKPILAPRLRFLCNEIGFNSIEETLKCEEVLKY